MTGGRSVTGPPVRWCNTNEARMHLPASGDSGRFSLETGEIPDTSGL